MDLWIGALVIWLALLCTIVWVRAGWSNARWARGIAFAPTEAVSAQHLFGLLLGANLALLEHDDFNQLASKLPRRRIRELLAQHWKVRSALDFQQVIDERLRSLGAASVAQSQAFESWQAGAPVDTAAYRSLRDVLAFLSGHAGIVRPGEIHARHFDLVAWDVQQLAYLLRLGFTMGYASRASVWRTLDHLRQTARMHCMSWKDYSLSALVGMGLRGVLDLDDIGDWYRIARSHTVLLAARRSLLARAVDWTSSTHPADVEPVSGFAACDMPSTAFDLLR